MADIKLIIKIDEDDRYRIVSGFANEDDAILFADLLKNGTPLPKGHGDLIDRDEFHQTLENINIKDNDKWFNWLQKACIRLAESPTIIEADKAESEETNER